MPKTTSILPDDIIEDVERLAHWLMADQHETCILMFSQFLEKPLIKKALFEEKNQLLYNAISEKLFESADTLIDEKINDSYSDAVKENFKQHIKAHLLGLLPFFEPEKGLEFSSKHLGRFKIESVDSITPRIFGAPYDLYHVTEGDESGIASSNILFMGTNPIPTASGSFWTRFADLIPGLPIGFILDQLGMNTVEKYVTHAHAKADGRSVNFIGQSLGGILSIMAGERYPSAHVYAIAPPFLLNKTYILTYFGLLSFTATALILIAGNMMPTVVFGYPSSIAALICAMTVSILLMLSLKLLIKPTQPITHTETLPKRVIYSHQDDVVHWLGLRAPNNYTIRDIPLKPMLEIKKKISIASFIDAVCLSLIIAAIDTAIMPLSISTIVIISSAFLIGLLARGIAQTISSYWSHMLNRHACRGDFNPEINHNITLHSPKSRIMIMSLFHTLIALPSMLILTPYLVFIKPIQTFLAWIHIPKRMVNPMIFLALSALLTLIPPISNFITVQINQALHAQGLIHLIGVYAQNIGTVLTSMIAITILSISLYTIFKCLGKLLSLYEKTLGCLTSTTMEDQEPSSCIGSKNDDKDALSHRISRSLVKNAHSNQFKVDDTVRKGEQPIEGNKNTLQSLTLTKDLK